MGMKCQVVLGSPMLVCIGSKTFFEVFCQVCHNNVKGFYNEILTRMHLHIHSMYTSESSHKKKKKLVLVVSCSDQKRASHLLELEIQMTMRRHMDAGNQAQVLKTSQYS